MTDEQKDRRSSRSVSRQDVCAPGNNAAPGETWRVFCAVEIPLETRRQIVQHAASLRAQLPDVRASWVREENLHLTLKFFANLPVSRIETLINAAARATKTVPPFEISLGGCGSFPPRGAPRVLWIGLNDSTGGMEQLYRALQNECAAAGFEKETRPFHPHLTVARVRHPQGASELARIHKETGFGQIEISVAELLVIRSQLSPQGSRYVELSRQALGHAKIGHR